MSLEVLILFPPAKINLWLRVLGHRKDGYHEVSTLLQMVDLRDRLTLCRRPGGTRVYCSHPDVPDGPENLAHQAACLFFDCIGTRGGVSIYIEKRIPMEAGLGGGSADAAATLWGLNRLWNGGLSKEELKSLAKKVGTDVPFFLEGPRALGEGRGERLTEVDPEPSSPVVIVTPRIRISTCWAYETLKLKLTEKGRSPTIYSPPRDLSAIPKDRWSNDLEEVVAAAHPVIKELRGRLTAEGAEFTSMTGSGPSVYGLFSNPASAIRAVRSLRHPSCECWLTRTLSGRQKTFGA